MAEHPILLSAPDVRAVMAGRKTHLRALLKTQPVMRGQDDCVITYERGGRTFSGPPDFMIRDILPRYGLRWRVGDRLWVRETWAPFEGDGPRALYRADADDDGFTVPYLITGAGGSGGGVTTYRVPCWRSSIHMPRWAGRLTLEVTELRVQRLQDISEADAIAEGVTDEDWEQWREDAAAIGAPPGTVLETARDRFRNRWLMRHPIKAGVTMTTWDENPWVSATTFRAVEKPNA